MTYITIPKLGPVRLAQEIRLPGRIVSARIKRRADKWFISFQIEVDESWLHQRRRENQAKGVAAIDLGLIDLATVYDGKLAQKVSRRRYEDKLEKRLRRAQKTLSRRVKGSANWKKAKLLLGRLHYRLGCLRQNLTHQLTTLLTRTYRVVILEDLNVAGMQRGGGKRKRGLNRSLASACFGEIRRQLEYKQQLNCGFVLEVDRFYPSSKTCSACGVVNRALRMQDRQWTCSDCGTAHDRDVNAAINLFNFFADGSSEKSNACGEDVSPMVEIPPGSLNEAGSSSSVSHSVMEFQS